MRECTSKFAASLSKSNLKCRERRERSFGLIARNVLINRRRHVKEGNVITYIGAGVNVLLSAMKVWFYIWRFICRLYLVICCIHPLSLLVNTNSLDLSVDAVHSLSDLIADGMALATVKKSRQDPDSLYP